MRKAHDSDSAQGDAVGEVGHVFEPVFQVTREHIGQGVCQVAMAALSVHQVSVPWLEIHVPQQTLTLVSSTKEKR